MLVPLLVILIFMLVITTTLLMRGDKRYSPIEYYARARENGLSFGEARFVHETAKMSGMRDPTNVLWAIKDLDSCIRAISHRLKAEGRDRDRGSLLLLERLYDLRKRIEFDRPKYSGGIRSSHSLQGGQRLRILMEGMGVFNASVIDNNERYLVTSYPIGAKLPPGFQWKGAHISVYFWRQEDAGYVFDSYVLDDLRIRSIPVLQVGHSEALFRTQKRKSVRIRSKMPSFLYLLRRLEGAYEKAERVPGLKCIVQDLSEDGIAILIGGKAKVGLLVKVQFFIGEEQLIMSGTVRAAEYQTDKNQSLLHIEAVKPSPRMKNLIRAYVYNIYSDPGRDKDAGSPSSGLDESVFSV